MTRPSALKLLLLVRGCRHVGATLNATIAMDGYTMTDRATWIAFGNKADHEILVEGDKALFIDPYYATYPGPLRAGGAPPTLCAPNPPHAFG